MSGGQIDCRAFAREIDDQTRAAVAAFETMQLRLVEILASDNPGVLSYSETKRKKAASLGIEYVGEVLPRHLSQAQVEARISQLNQDPTVAGLIVGMPVYAHLDGSALANKISPVKDVDGLGVENSAALFTGDEHQSLQPATAIAAILITERQVRLAGKRALVIGRGRTVGRPLASMLINRDATVTVFHSKSHDLPRIVESHDIIFSATGMPEYVEGAWFKPGQIVVDCGIGYQEGRLTGDLSLQGLPSGVFYTSVPGGVGVVTNSVLFSNVLRAAAIQKSSRHGT